MSRDAMGLERRDANYSPLTPLALLQRTAGVFPDKVAVVDDGETWTYAGFLERCTRLAAALTDLGIQPGETVSILSHNGHELLECHFGVPMAGAVLNALNTRLDAGSLAFILQHAEARVLFYDAAFQELVDKVLQGLDRRPRLVRIGPALQGEPLQALSYEDLLRQGDAHRPWRRPRDEWEPIALNYTSGTTGKPKGVVYHHRGAFLAALSNALAFDMGASAVYLWTLPMFHCNGWCYTWAVTALGGTHVCLDKVDPAVVLEHIEARGITHMCGAPVVLNLLLNDFHRKGATLPHRVKFALGGAAPPSPVIDRAQRIGFEIVHLYGLTESYGPSMLCVPQNAWQDLSIDDLALKMARQGVGNFAIDEVRVVDTADDRPVPRDGAALGEIVMRGNTIMRGYLKNPEATDAAFRDGWFRTGDLAVVHPDGYVEIKDRAKDIIISGGENISSQEIEEVLYRHPAVYEAAVVALPDATWGEVPCAFVCLRDGPDAPGEAELIAHCRAGMASFKVPKRVILGELPKTATGKIRKNVLRQQLAHSISLSTQKQ